MAGLTPEDCWMTDITESSGNVFADLGCDVEISVRPAANGASFRHGRITVAA